MRREERKREGGAVEGEKKEHKRGERERVGQRDERKEKERRIEE